MKWFLSGLGVLVAIAIAIAGTAFVFLRREKSSSQSEEKAKKEDPAGTGGVGAPAPAPVRRPLRLGIFAKGLGAPARPASESPTTIGGVFRDAFRSAVESAEDRLIETASEEFLG